MESSEEEKAVENQDSPGFVPQSSHLEVKFLGYPKVPNKSLEVVGLPESSTCSILPRKSPSPKPAIMQKEEGVLETPKIDVSVERLVFLERVEKLMANEGRIKELEAENRALLSVVAKLGAEIENLRKPKV
jgi:hypothetical protein